jgi:uncharacterized protein YukE
MTQPSSQQVTVATDTLRAESVEWDRQSEAATALAVKVAGMELGRVEAGLFQLIVSPYNEVVEAVHSRCSEAATAMRDVASTLRTVAATYDEEDRANEHRIRKIY